MGIPKYAHKRDKNEPPIIAALEGVGAAVQQLSEEGVPDLLVAFRGTLYLMEVKMPKKNLTPAEREWHLNWPIWVYIVRTPEEALQAIHFDPQEYFR